MIDIFEYCRMFYASHYLPVAVYRGGERAIAFCSLEGELNVFSAAEDALLTAVQNPAVFASAAAGLYGVVRVEATGDSVIVGPVFSGEITDESVYGFMRKNAIGVTRRNDVAAFLASLPKSTYNQFLNLLAFLHLGLNHEVVSVIEHFHLSDTKPEAEIAAMHTLSSVERRESKAEHGTYQFEKLLLELVRHGETDKLDDFLNRALNTAKLQEGVLAENPLRQAKNLLIGLVTTVGKVAAIDGGMDVEEAYSLIDLYIQECEKAQSVEMVKTLQYNLLFDFTERVGHSSIPPGTSKEIFSCIQYIKNRTNDRISLDEVAGHIGRSRAFLTQRFRKETGMTVGGFIMKCKLRYARSLLRHSDMSLAEISGYLCFSSQSYFQNVFKKEYGVTPAQCRNQAVEKSM